MEHAGGVRFVGWSGDTSCVECHGCQGQGLPAWLRARRGQLTPAYDFRGIGTLTFPSKMLPCRPPVIARLPGVKLYFLQPQLGVGNALVRAVQCLSAHSLQGSVCQMRGGWG